MSLRVRRTFLGLVGAAGLGLLAGCAGIPLGLEKPDVSIAGLRLLDGNLIEQRFVVTLRVTNPNNVDIPIEGLNFDLDLNGQPFAKGVSNKATLIPRLGEGTLEVVTTTGLSSLFRQLGELGKGKAGYRIRGRLVTGTLGSFNFDRSGEVELSRLLDRLGGRPGAGTGERRGEGQALPPTEKF